MLKAVSHDQRIHEAETVAVIIPTLNEECSIERSSMTFLLALS